MAMGMVMFPSHFAYRFIVSLPPNCSILQYKPVTVYKIR